MKKAEKAANAKIIEKIVKRLEKMETSELELVDRITSKPKKMAVFVAEETEKRDPNIRDIVAFIPGTVLKVFIKAGDEVKKGDKLLILNAMKMDNELLAPSNGIIVNVHAEEGQVVPKNFILVEIA